MDDLERAIQNVVALSEEAGSTFALERLGFEPVDTRMVALELEERAAWGSGAGAFLHGLLCGAAYKELLQQEREAG